MTRPRRELVSLESTHYYHLMSRCVRRAWLCGKDPLTGHDYSHRRRWVLDRLTVLGEVFAVDLVGYAVMSNHYHLVVRVDAERVSDWGEREVIRRWAKIRGLPVLVKRYELGERLGQAERKVVLKILSEWRRRLGDLSWYMRCLNEHIARLANNEDGCRGRFWEGRFQSQALLDERALIQCLGYVDLNPLRAGEVNEPEASPYTSLYQRLNDMPGGPVLLAFSEIDLELSSYLELIDWCGRAIRSDKSGYIPPGYPHIIKRLDCQTDDWLQALRYAGHRHGLVKGALEQVQAFVQRLGQQWVRGQRLAYR